MLRGYCCVLSKAHTQTCAVHKLIENRLVPAPSPYIAEARWWLLRVRGIHHFVLNFLIVLNAPSKCLIAHVAFKMHVTNQSFLLYCVSHSVACWRLWASQIVKNGSIHQSSRRKNTERPSESLSLSVCDMILRGEILKLSSHVLKKTSKIQCAAAPPHQQLYHMAAISRGWHTCQLCL